jgi:hypothetical protein
MPMAYAAPNIRMLAEVTEATNTAPDSYVFVHATTETISVVTPANGTLTIIYNYSFEQGLEPIDVRIDSSGNYIISEVGIPAIPTGGMITKITPGGVRTVIYTFPWGVNPSGIAIDSSGNYIVVEGGSRVLSKITPSGVRTVIYNFTPGSASDVTVDSYGNYIVTELWPDALSKITPSGVRTVIYNFTMPSNMVHVDPSGNYIVTESTASLISKITPDGVRTIIYHFTNLPIHFPTVWPSDAWVDSSGNYIVTESNNHVLSKITPDGVRTVLYTFPSLGSISAFAPIPQADTEPPVISSISPSNASTLSNPTVTINAHYSDNVAIRNYSFRIDGVAVTPNTVTASELEYTANFSEGPHTVQLSLTDTSDNAATATWSFTVQVPQPSR